jgi:hypothetical protein
MAFTAVPRRVVIRMPHSRSMPQLFQSGFFLWLRCRDPLPLVIV